MKLVSEGKNEIRKRMLALRDQVTERERKSQRIMEKIIASPQYKEAEYILAYASIGSEVETEFLLSHALLQGKKLYLPKTYENPHEILFYRLYHLEDLKKCGRYQIPEPPETALFDCHTPALVILPGVAFDKDGNRMGYGGGYYDRFLANPFLSVVKIMAAFHEQEIQKLPVDERDIRPDVVVTDK